MAQFKGIRLMPSELRQCAALIVVPFEGVEPHLAGEPQFCGRASSIIGRVRIGVDAAIGPCSVIRADGHFVQIGECFSLGQFSTVHIAHDVYPTVIGNRVTVGRNAVVHACTVGDDCVIEDDVVILDGSVIGDGVLIEAESIVFPRSRLRGGFVYAGSPAVQIRGSTSDERAQRATALQEAVATSLLSTVTEESGPRKEFGDDVFVARTAHLVGKIELRSHSSVFFACHIDASHASMIVGENSNIQDNVHIQCSEGDVAVGRDTTIGHNVRMQACQIGERSLVGIGSVVCAGTTIEDDVLLAAGSATGPGQHLERGWLWGGRPAKPISRLDDAKRKMIRATIDHYRSYGEAYRRMQRHLAR